MKVEEFEYPVGNIFVIYHDPPTFMPGLKPLFLKSNFLSRGIPLCCESISQSDVRKFNRRIVNGEVGNISEGLWRSMNSLCITNVSNNCDLVSRIEEME